MPILDSRIRILCFALATAITACGGEHNDAQTPPPVVATTPAPTTPMTTAPVAPMVPPATSPTTTVEIEEYKLALDPIPGMDRPPPSDPQGPPQPTPAGDRQAVVQKAQRRLRSHYREMRACYDQAYLRNSKLAGTVSFRFTLMPTGEVTQPVDAGSTLTDPEVLRCVSNVIVRTKFDPFDGKAIKLLEPLEFVPPTARSK